ncbi:MAG: efflux RND transporter periplasmic adaptor subunit [Tannerella sp.]|nr:efflux RND transporter periplasmic adaptor subunit [Tannerella sp.]
MKKIYLLGATLMSLIVISCGKQQTGSNQVGQPQSYPTATVATGAAELITYYPATLRGKEDIEIRPRIDGFIENILIDEGSVVRQGQVLFKINSPQAEQAVTTAQAAVTVADAQLATAELNVSRMKPLADKGIISSVQLDAYINAHNAAKASREQALAQLKNARATLSWTSVTSPVNGHVGAVTYRKGSLVNSQNVLTTVANTSTVFAYFSLNEKELVEFLGRFEGVTQAEKLKKAPEVTLTLADGSVYPSKGRIETIAGVVNITTGSAGLRAEFPNAEGLLRSGTSGKIALPASYSDVIIIPQRATFAQQDKTLVYVVEEGVANQRIIDVTSTPDGQTYIVHSGLRAGERIVTEGVATLVNGTKIANQ